jgi:lysyl-tRNA synthetase, class II
VQKAFELRANAINELRKTKNPDPYPHKFQTSTTIPEFVAKYQHLKRGEQLKGEMVTLAGRALEKRDARNILFYDLHGDVPPPTLWA